MILCDTTADELSWLDELTILSPDIRAAIIVLLDALVIGDVQTLHSGKATSDKPCEEAK